MGSAFYVKNGSLAGVQKRDGWEIVEVAVADTENAARSAIGPAVRGWRTRVVCRYIRASGVMLAVYVGVRLRKRAPTKESEEVQP